MVSENKIFKHSYENRPFLPPKQPIKFTDLDKSHMKRRGLLNKHFCKKKIQISPIRQKKLLTSSFPIRPNKNISVVRVTCQKKLGRVGREIFFFQDLFYIEKCIPILPGHIFSPVTHLSAVLN